MVSIFAITRCNSPIHLYIQLLLFNVQGSKRSSQNPWGSNTLEWTTPIDPIHGNWPGPLPTVHRWAYDYSKPGKPEDFVPTNGAALEDGELDGGGH